MKKLHYYFLFIVFAFAACEEIPVNPDGPTNEAISISIIPNTATYVRTALEVRANVNLDTLSSYSFEIGGEDAEVLSAIDSTATLKVPENLSPGQHAVSIVYQGEVVNSNHPLDILDHRETTIEGLAFAFTDNPLYPVAALTEDGDALIPTVDVNGILTGAVYLHDDVKTEVLLNTSGLPAMVSTGGYTMLFDNYTEIGFDMAVISAEGEISTYRELEADWDNGRLQSMGAVSALSEAISGLRVLSCGMSESMLAAGVSPQAVQGLSSCRSPLALTPSGTLNGLSIDDIEGTAPAFGVFSGPLGCIQTMRPPYPESARDCSAFLVSQAIDYSVFAQQQREENAESINIAYQSLQFGGGDIQITLTWDNTADIDLHVIDPNGERIAYFWLRGQAPQGAYIVEVDHFSGISPTNFTVLVHALGRTQRYNGYVEAEQTINVVNFTLGETLPEGRMEIIGDNTRLNKPSK